MGSVKMHSVDFEKFGNHFLLEKILEKAQHLEKLTTHLRHGLAKELAPHCHITDIQDTSLTLATDSPTILMSLRYQSEALLRYLNQAHPQKKSWQTLKMKVCPVSPTTQASPLPTEKALELSTKSQHAITQLTQHIQHPRLREALLGLVDKEEN